MVLCHSLLGNVVPANRAGYMSPCEGAGGVQIRIPNFKAFTAKTLDEQPYPCAHLLLENYSLTIMVPASALLLRYLSRTLGLSCGLGLRRMWRSRAQIAIHKPAAACLRLPVLCITMVATMDCELIVRILEGPAIPAKRAKSPVCYLLTCHTLEVQHRCGDSAVPGLKSMGQIWKAHRRPLEGRKAQCIALACHG